MSIWHPIVELRLFQNLTLKFKGQGHRWGHSSKSQCGYNILLTHIPFVPCQSALPFLRYSIFKIWPWKWRVKVTVLVTMTHIPFVPCQSGIPFLSYDFFKIWQGHIMGITSYHLISLSFYVDRPSHSWDAAIKKTDLENQRSRSWVRSQFKVTMWV